MLRSSPTLWIQHSGIPAKQLLPKIAGHDMKELSARNVAKAIKSLMTPAYIRHVLQQLPVPIQEIDTRLRSLGFKGL